MDAIEIVMEFEAAFGLAIPDEVAVAMRTPRDMRAFAEARLPTIRADRCRTQRTFYRLRRGFRAALGPAADLRVDTPLRSLASRHDWHVLWTRVRVHAGEPHWPAAMPIFALFEPRTIALGQLARRIEWAKRRAPGEPWTREEIDLAIRRSVHDVTAKEDFAMTDDFVRDIKIS